MVALFPMAQLRSRPIRHGSDDITRNLPGIDFEMKSRLVHRELKRRAFASTAHFSRLKPSGYEKRKSRVDFSSFASTSTSPLHATRSALPRAAPCSRSLRSSLFVRMLARAAPAPHHPRRSLRPHASPPPFHIRRRARFCSIYGGEGTERQIPLKRSSRSIILNKVH